MPLSRAHTPAWSLFNAVANAALHPHTCSMRDTERFSETVLERNQRREAEINDALKQEYARREAAVKNMYRLRASRIARDQKAKTAQSAKPLARGHSTANASA
jgi:hypothetical protein